jgi:hypothetical protein
MVPLTFLSPVFLVGMAAAIIPLIIHLSRSRRTKKMRFSTTRFFTDQFLRSYRMSRLKELLLLALRMALCALLAVALARPLLLPKGQAFWSSGSRAVVLVLDNSASMGYTEDGVALLDRARAAAREVLDGLHPGDTASVVLAGRRAEGPEVLFPQPTPDLGDVTQAVNSVPVRALATDLTGAVLRAEEVLSHSQAATKEVYVFSDLQESGWETPEEPTSRGSSDALFFFVRVRPKVVTNLAVTAVQYATARPMVGVPFAIRAHIASQGDQPRPADVRLYIDGQKVSERRLEKLPDGRWAVPRFFHTFTTGGWHSGYVEVPDDNLTLDNRRYFAFEVLDQVPVLAVNGAPSQVPHLDELLYLKFALTGAQEPDKVPVKLKEIVPADLANADLTGYPLVILANVEALSDLAVERLEAFVDRGGSLLVFLGDKVNATVYNQNLAAPNRLHGGLLPGRLLKVEGDPAGPETFASIATVDYDYTPLESFRDSRIDFTRVTFKALWGVDAGSAAVLMRASTGAPLLCEKAFGKGRVLLFTSTCDRDWTNFPTRPAYLPWVYQLVGYLAQDPLVPQAFYTTGSRVRVPVSAAEGIPQLVIKKPDGTLGRVTTSPEDPDDPVGFTDTAQTGIYTLLAPDQKDKAPLVAVNLDGYESRLTSLDDVLAEPGTDAATRTEKVEAGLKEYFPGRPLVTYVDDPSGVSEASLSARRGVKLWDIVLAVVLFIALFEPWLANRISARHYSLGPQAAPVGRPSPAVRTAWEGRPTEALRPDPQAQEARSS